MKITRALLSGAFVWIMIFALFTIMSFIPVIKDSKLQQDMLVFIFLIPFAMAGAAFYYKKGSQTNGLIIGSIMVAISLTLDALITVPYVIVPQGGSYASFFTDPFMAIIGVEFIATVYFYWKVKIKPQLNVEATSN